MQTGVKYLFLYWFPPLFWMVFIFPANENLTSEHTSLFLYPIIKFFLPHADIAFVEAVHVLIRKLTHFFNYAFLAFLLCRAFHSSDRIWKWKWLLYGSLIAVSYGAADEGLQALIPSRTGSVYDWLLDSTGVIFTLGILSEKVRKTKSVD